MSVYDEILVLSRQALLDFAVDVEQTPEEAEQELREMGVDVTAFLARARERRARQADEEGLRSLALERDLCREEQGGAG